MTLNDSAQFLPQKKRKLVEKRVVPGKGIGQQERALNELHMKVKQKVYGIELRKMAGFQKKTKRLSPINNKKFQEK